MKLRGTGYIGTSNIVKRRKMKSSNKLSQRKTPQYQDYRTKAHSELDCSGLFSGIDELDQKMKQYQELKKGKNSLSTSHIECPSPLKENDSLLLSSVCSTPNNCDNKTDRYQGSALQTIEQHNPRTRTTKFPTTMSSSTIFPKASKPLLAKTVNTNPKDKECKQQKLSCLRLKTKQLQQELLDAFSGDPIKKNNINREFATLFKLLQ